MLDVRKPISLFFFVIGGIILVWGFVHPETTDVGTPQGTYAVNLNIPWGGVMVAFALAIGSLALWDDASKAEAELREKEEAEAEAEAKAEAEAAECEDDQSLGGEEPAGGDEEPGGNVETGDGSEETGGGSEESAGGSEESGS